MASLAGPGSRVQDALISDDTVSTINACRALGAELNTVRSTIQVDEAISAPGHTCIDAANSGTTIRMATALAALFPTTTTLTGDASLQKRPMQPLADAIVSLGGSCHTTDGCPPLKVSGVIRGGPVEVYGEVSSQFVSALMMFAPLTQHGVDIHIQGGLVSKPYLDITMAVMRRFGATVRTVVPYLRYSIPPSQYRPADFVVPMDFSTLSLILAAATLCGKDMTVQGTIDGLPQGDEAFLDILERLGVRVDIEETSLRVSAPDKLEGGTFNLGNSPDLLPPLAILAVKPGDTIRITGVSHARLKETDRISVLAQELTKIGIDVTENEDGLILRPPPGGVRLGGSRASGSRASGLGPKDVTLDSHGDHRMFMAFCIAGMYAGECTVTDAESAAVSYPDFVSDMKRLGGNLILER